MNPTNIAWLFTLLAALCEVCWLLSIKYLDFKALSSFKWVKFHNVQESLSTLVPFICYLGFGLANVICFSIASKKLPTAVVFATWLAVALVITTVIDVGYFKESYSRLQYVFIIVILVGVVGLKMSTK